MAGDVSIITAPTPRMIESRNGFPNFDFSIGGLTDPPSNWVKTGTDIFTAAEDAVFFDRGSGFTHRTAKSISNTETMVIATDFSTPGLAAVGEPYVAQVAIYVVGPAQPTLDIWVFSYDTSDVIQELWLPLVITAGVPIGEWFFVQMVFTPTDPDTTKFKIHLYDNSQNNTAVYWAYPHFGRLFDFDRKFTDFIWKETANVSLALGNNIYEIVREGEPLLNISFGWKDLGIVSGSNTEIAWNRWWSYAARKNVFSFWEDATKWKNSENHFAKCISRETMETVHKPSGATAYRSMHSAWVPEETRIQPIPRQ